MPIGYPKDLHQTTEVEVTDVDGSSSVQIHLKRKDSTINNYCPALLSSWRANMDIQLIGNAYGAAEYTAVYVSKAEPDTLRFRKVIGDALHRCDPNLPDYAILKRVANATLSIREVSAQEAYYILLRELPLFGKSRQIERVKVMRHSQRYYRVDAKDLLNDESSSDQTSSIRVEPVEIAYMARPIELPFQDMTFATFVEEYELLDTVCAVKTQSNCWERRDGNGFIKLRNKAHEVRATPGMIPNSANPNFCFAELFLHKSWRSLTDLPETDEECLASFEQEQQNALGSEVHQESSLKLDRQRELDTLKNFNAVRVCATLPASEYVFINSEPDLEQVNLLPESNESNQSDPAALRPTMQWTAKHAYTTEDVVKARGFLKTHIKPWIKLQKDVRRSSNSQRNLVGQRSSYLYPVNNDNGIQTEVMDESQWIPFAFAMRQSRARFRAVLDNSICQPLQMIIHGEGGSGKSWLIKHIVKDVHNVFSEHSSTRRTSKRVLLLAHQGTAAFNIKGQTICSAFELTSFSRSAYSTSYVSTSTLKGGVAKLKRLQDQYVDVHLVIIDEFSVISCGMLYWIDQRMREIWPKCCHMPFGGRDVIFTGYLAQLDPVIPCALSSPINKIQNQTQLLGREIWQNISIVCALTSQNRGKNDPEWFNALRRLRCKCPTQADVDLFNTIFCKGSEMPSWSPESKHIAYMNADVDDANRHSLENGSHSVFHIRSKHTVKLKRLAQQKEVSPESIQVLLEDAKSARSDRDRVVRSYLNIAIGAPVTLTFNMEQTAGLCNGTNGVIYDLIFTADTELPIILVEIVDTYIGPSFLPDVANIVPIIPRKVSWGKKTSNLTVFREGIPLRLAYAITVHKVQGLTCMKVVFHSHSIPSASFA